MSYDIYTPFQCFAEELFNDSEEDYYLDSFVDEEMYGFRDLNFLKLSKMKKLLFEHPEAYEIRSSENGDIVWPNPRGFSLDQVLDVL